MKVLCTAMLVLALGAASSSSVSARTSGTHARTVVATFRLQVSGHPEAATTFWVAWGPLGGHFGLVELRSQGSGRYAASAVLPAQGRTIFAYLAGHGVTQTRLGPVPGDPVLTIKTTGQLPLSNLRLPVVTWQVPVG